MFIAFPYNLFCWFIGIPYVRLYCQGLIDCCFQAKNTCILIIGRQRPHWFMSTFVCAGRSRLLEARALCSCAPWWSRSIAFGEGSATVSKVSIRYLSLKTSCLQWSCQVREVLCDNNVLRFYCLLSFSRYKGHYMKPPIWIEAVTGRRR